MSFKVWAEAQRAKAQAKAAAMSKDVPAANEPAIHLEITPAEAEPAPKS